MARVKLECTAQVVLVTASREPVRLGRYERVEEALHLGGWPCAGELRGHAAVPERLHGGDSLNAEGGLQPRVPLDVDLGQLDLAGTGLRGALEHRRQLLARTAPVGPEVHDDRDLDR